MTALDTGSTVSQQSTQEWTDSKRYLWLLGLVVPSLAFIAWGMHALTGWGVWWWIGPIVVFGVIPVIDLATGLDRSNPPDDVIEALENDKYYRWITYLFLPIQYAALVWACWMFTSGDLPLVDKVGLALSIGTIAGIGINTAHELGHKKEQHERWLAKIALAQSFYGHFYIEHNRGHHVRVATPEDPASSRVGESLYAFLPRTVLGSLRSAWRLEKPRFARRNQSHLVDPQRRPELLADVRGPLGRADGRLRLADPAVPGDPGGRRAQPARGGQLPGALRHAPPAHGADGTGRYERVLPSHSWNSNNIATNVLLYHLQRHSDHHANPTRRYQTLRDFEESPALPTGYAGMILLAMVPPLWRRVMDPRVLAHFDGDMSRANLQPGKRDAILARYPAPASAGQR